MKGVCYFFLVEMRSHLFLCKPGELGKVSFYFCSFYCCNRSVFPNASKDFACIFSITNTFEPKVGRSLKPNATPEMEVDLGKYENTPEQILLGRRELKAQ